jgi:hypothetical protein
MIAHTRQLRAAMWSHESTQEGKDNGFAPAKARKTDKISDHVLKFKVRGKFAGGDQV